MSNGDKGSSRLTELLGILIAAIVLLVVVAMVLQKVIEVLLIGTAIILGGLLALKLLFPRHFDEFVARKSLGDHYLPPHERYERGHVPRGNRRREQLASREADNVITFDRHQDDPTERRRSEQLNKRLSDTVRRNQKRRNRQGKRRDRPSGPLD